MKTDQLTSQYLDKACSKGTILIFKTQAIYKPRILLGWYRWYRRILTGEVVGWVNGCNLPRGFIILSQHRGGSEPWPVRVYLEDIRSWDELTEAAFARTS